MGAKIDASVVIARAKDRGVEIVDYAGTTNGLSHLRCMSCGHEWRTGATKILRGGGCPLCANKRRSLSKLMPYETVLEGLSSRQIELLEYGGSHRAHSRFKCRVCTHEWCAKLNNIRMGGGCPKCAGTMRLSETAIKDSLLARGILLREYGGSTMRKSKFKCANSLCGHEWVTSAGPVLRGANCPKCAGTSPIAYEDALKRMRASGKGFAMVEYSGTSSGTSRFRCTLDACGHEWSTSLKNALREKSGCPKCSGRAPVTIYDVAERLIGRPIELLEYGGKVAAKSLFRCKNKGCDNEWWATFNSIHAGGGCPKCAKHGFKVDKPATVYVYKITGRFDEYIGYGITGNMKVRGARHESQLRKAGYSSELVRTELVSGRTALSVEAALKGELETRNLGVNGFQREAAPYRQDQLDIVNAVLDSRLNKVSPKKGVIS